MFQKQFSSKELNDVQGNKIFLPKRREEYDRVNYSLILSTNLLQTRDGIDKKGISFHFFATKILMRKRKGIIFIFWNGPISRELRERTTVRNWLHRYRACSTYIGETHWTVEILQLKTSIFRIFFEYFFFPLFSISIFANLTRCLRYITFLP